MTPTYQKTFTYQDCLQSRRVVRVVAIAAMVLSGLPWSAWGQALPHNIPNFCASATITSAQSGVWSDPATWSPSRVPAAGDVVRIATGHTVTYNTVSSAAINCVGIDGQLTFRTDISTRLTVGTLMVMPGGELQIGTTAAPVAAGVVAEVIIANRPLNTATDPDQFGTGLIGFGSVRLHGAPKSPTFVRLAAEPRAGQTTLTLAQAVSGWRVGDRIVLPDTRQLTASERFGNLSPQFEEFTLTQISGTQLTLDRAITYNHDGARNAQDNLELLPHAGNLTRNVIIQSENPAGTRGHTIYVHHASVDIRYALFKDLGRTTNDTPGGTNQIGRYPLHIHHVMGPPNPSNTGYQFTLVGNAIADSRKWPLTVHNSHYGLVRDNVVFNGLGAGFVTEDGNESYNEFIHNFGVGIFGDQKPIDQDGRDGSIFWFNGFNHTVRDNVAANAVNRTQAIVNGSGYNFTWPAASTANTHVPLFRGADVTVNGEYRLVDMKFVSIPEFSGNEAYGAMPTGLVVWQLGTDGYDTTGPMAETVIRNFTGWHLHESAFFGYPSHNMTFDGWVVRGQRRALGPYDGGTGWWIGDYKTRNATIRRANIQGMSNGLDASTATEGALLIEDSYFSNFGSNINVPTLATPGTGAIPDPRTTIVRNTQFDPMPGALQFITIEMDWRLDRGNSHPQTSDRLFLYDYDGVVGANSQVFYAEQATQDIAGGRATCTTTRVEIDGLVCPISGPVSPTLTGVTPTAGDTAGGTSLTISGANFLSGARVEFGGLAATNMVVASPTQITAQAPAHLAGLVSVNVTNGEGQRGRLADAYTFGTATACNYSLDSTGASYPATGGTGTVSVTANAGCDWFANSQDAWVTITSGSSGSGSGTVTYSVAANSSATPLTGTLVIAGQTFTVTQQAAGCSYTVSPTSQSATAAGGTGSVSVTTASGCSWTATSNATWMNITTDNSGSGNGTVSFSVAEYSGTSPRTGTLTMAGQTVTVTQQQPGPSCSYTVSPTTDSVPATGGARSVSVTVANGCSWTATSSATWISLTTGASGSGSGTVSFSVAANSGTSPRTGTLTVAAQTVTVTQSSAGRLVAAYGFNAGSGKVAADVSGNGNTGAISGARWTTGGRFGQALSFDGVNDWVTVADASSLDLTTGMTLEAWIRPTKLGGWRTVLLKESIGGLAYALYADNAASRPVGQAAIGGVDRTAVGTSAIPLNTWTHVAVTYSGTTLRFFVNGTEVNSLGVTGSIVTTSSPLRFGGNAVWGEWFAGQLDEIRIYNGPLSQTEIQSDMNTPVGGG